MLSQPKFINEADNKKTKHMGGLGQDPCQGNPNLY